MYMLKSLLSLCFAGAIVWLSAFSSFDFVAVVSVSNKNGTEIEKEQFTVSESGKVPGSHEKNKAGMDTKRPSRFEYTARNLYSLLEGPEEHLPEPLQILREYIQQHQADADSHNMNTLKKGDGRKYIVQGYVCPEQAGNMMGQALNAFLLAILTNRTLVMIPRNPEECHAIMSTADWVPTMRSVSDVPHEIEFIRPQYRKVCPEIFNITGLKAGKLQNACRDNLDEHPEEAVNLERQRDWRNKTFITFGYGQSLGFENTRFRAGYGNRYNISDPKTFTYIHGMFPGELIADEKMKKLFRHGMWFTYGMLWEYLFVNSAEFQAQVDRIQQTVNPEEPTVGIHVRHPKPTDDGSNIEVSQLCLEELLADETPSASKTQKGQLLIMTDRVAANNALAVYAGTKGYAGLTVKTALETSSSLRRRRLAKEKEHGPFQGAGFFLDMELVSMSNVAFAGTSRSSSELVLELMAYRQGMKLFSRETGKLSRSTRPQYCTLFQRGCRCLDTFLDSEL